MGSNGTQLVQEVTQAVIAVLVVVGGLALAIISITRGQNADSLPGWLELAIGAVLGFYYSRTGIQTTVQTMANGPMTAIAALAGRSGPRSTDPRPPTNPGATA